MTEPMNTVTHWITLLLTSAAVGLISGALLGYAILEYLDWLEALQR